MKKPLLVLCLFAMLTSSACSDPEAPEPSPAASAEALLARQIALDVETYEKAVGTTHGLTPDQIHQNMEKMRSEPAMRNRFLGIWTLQNPTDAWIIMEIMYEVKPDIMVETGTWYGGSAALWAIILEHINPEGRIITIDIEDQRPRAAIKLPIAQQRVDFLLGSSTAPEIVADVRRRTEGKRVMVLLDSLHSKEHVAAELEAYAPLVPVGSYVIVQDTGVGPSKAIEEFLAANDSFIADRGRERYADTNSVGGYLRRVK